MDIVLVTYNSEKWIENCLESINRSNPIDEPLNIYIVDNKSTDGSVAMAKAKKFRDGIHLKVFTMKRNLGFGRANNAGAAKGKDNIVLFINIDTEVYPDTFEKLREEIRTSDADVGAWELRQLPYEHCKLYDPITRETSWISGAAFAVRRDLYEKIGGFDPKIFMYGEDVDISWRMRAEGYTLKYCPKVKINHYAYTKANEVKPTQYLESVINNLLLRYRYGSVRTILRGHYLFGQIIAFHKPPFKGAKKELLKRYLKHFMKIPYYLGSRVKDRSVGKFLDWDYEEVRKGAFEEYRAPEKNELVSIIVRTCGRPDVLRETLISIRNQTYRNYEVVIVEDGEAISKEMLDTEFEDLPIRYCATIEKKGRSFAGNTAMAMAKGKYLNFLDDDDVFYADHLETLVARIEQSPCKAVYGFAFETPIKVYSKSPYHYELKGRVQRHTQTFNKAMLCHHNYMPIQCILFEKSLFEKYGGFDETLDYLEDWDLWVRYMQETDYDCVEKTTSEYRIPFKKDDVKSRQKQLDLALDVVRKKHRGYNLQVSVADLVKYGEKSLWQMIMERLYFRH